MTTQANEPDAPRFRNGMPPRMAGWMHIKQSRFKRRQYRFAKLFGEVLSFHESENRVAEEEFDIVGAVIEFADRDSKRSFRLTVGRRVYTCYCASFEEMQSWAQSLLFASTHCFDHCYTLGPLIAEGTFSRVYYAYARTDPKLVFAVKVVKKRPHDLQALEWLRRERHVNSGLNHPTIVQAVDMFSSTEKDYLVFEYMRGGTLADLLEKHKRLPESYARVVMRELFTALHYIHSKNIVHRDVRPENIFCSGTRFPMSIALGDFGLSNFLSEKRVNHDVLTSMLGTPPYIAVDIVRRVRYGPIADMWSAGVVLYHVLSGELPFTGRSDREVIEKIKVGRVSFDSPAWQGISADAIGLTRQLLQTNPFKRISALASLQHRWLTSASTPQGLSRPTSTTSTSYPTSPTTNNGQLSYQVPSGMYAMGDRDSPGNTSTDSRKPGLTGNVSNLSRVPSSGSWQSPSDGLVHSGSERNDSAGRQTSLLGQQLVSTMHQGSSMRSMQPVSSVSSLSVAGGGAQPRLQVTPSVRAIAERGLQRVTSDNPARMKRLLSSRLVQKQLSAALPFRRKLVVTARAFIAVFRLQAITRGQSATRQLSVLGRTDVEEVNEMLDRRKAALEESRSVKAMEKDGDGVGGGGGGETMAQRVLGRGGDCGGRKKRIGLMQG